MVLEGKAEEVFQLFLADFERAKSKNYDPVYLTYIARQINDKWRKSSPGPDYDRMKTHLQEYLKDFP